MKIAFTAKGTSWESAMDPRFGRAEYFVIYEEETKEQSWYDNRPNSQEEHGAGPKAAQALFNLGVNLLITGNGPGGNAAAVMGKAGIQVMVGAGSGTVKEAWEAYQNKELQLFTI